jgi:N,N-dimethylformamidase
MDIVGYTDRLCAAPGEAVAFKVSTRLPGYRAGLVRLIHGDDDPAGPGLKEQELDASFAGEHPGRAQELGSGSFVRCPPLALPAAFELELWICPTTPGSGEQAVLSHGGSWLGLDAQGALAFSAEGESISTGRPLLAWEWYHVTAAVDGRELRLEQRPLRAFVLGESAVASGTLGAAPATRAAPVALAARLDGERHDLHFNGRIEDPAITAGGETLARWDLAQGISTLIARDVSGGGRDGELVNMPMRAVSGRRFDGSALSFLDAPEHYAAIHFHDDDLDDAGWGTDFTFTVPDDLASGVYAARLRSGEAQEYLPFFVRPARGTSGAELAFLAPTLSYLAYANEHYSWSPAFRMWAPGNVMERLTERDRFMEQHRLLSLYDFHSDGTGPCYSSYLRPLLSLRPCYDMPLISAPHQFNADLHLLDWLEALGIARDVLTDHDLHAEGLELLARYRVLLTGSHPEYWTGAMLDALEAYLEGGGRLLYLGGNGFWWVTSIHPAAPHLIEMRRGLSGSRPWSSRAGEVFHGGTGEFGGQWRYRGRAPQRLVGVGFTAQGSDASRPYRRLPASFDPRASWIFDGVGESETIGDFGLVMGAAGGAEIDRADHALGTPPHALVVARASGYTDMYQAQQDDTLFHDSKQGGTTSPLVRADMVFFETGAGGAVFAPGSISWCGSLSHDGYANNVSRITENVVRRFLDPEPFPAPPRA